MRLAPDNPLTARGPSSPLADGAIELLLKEYGEEPAAGRIARGNRRSPPSAAFHDDS